MKRELAENIQAQEIETVIEPSRGWLNLDLKSLWEYRELLLFLAWRDIKVRYKQTALGAAWAILQPLLTVVLFSVIFGYLAGLSSDGIPYPVFIFTALLPWQLFATALTRASTSLVSDQNLIKKVYFPRLIIPLSSILAGVVDFLIGFLVLVGMMVIYAVPISWRLAVVPLLVLYALVTALAMGLWFSALNVKYRDVLYTMPFVSQLWFYATPIAYSTTLIPENWRLVYGVNPMVGVVEAFRWALLGTTNFDGLLFGISALVVLLMFAGGLVYFRRMEDEFADLV